MKVRGSSKVKSRDVAAAILDGNLWVLGNIWQLNYCRIWLFLTLLKGNSHICCLQFSSLLSIGVVLLFSQELSRQWRGPGCHAICCINFDRRRVHMYRSGQELICVVANCKDCIVSIGPTG